LPHHNPYDTSKAQDFAADNVGVTPSIKLRTVLDEIMRDKSKFKEIVVRFQRDDPALLQELIDFVESQQRK